MTRSSAGGNLSHESLRVRRLQSLRPRSGDRDSESRVAGPQPAARATAAGARRAANVTGLADSTRAGLGPAALEPPCHDDS